MKRNLLLVAAAVLAAPVLALAQYSIYYMGSSFTDQINYQGFKALTVNGGHDPYTFGRHMIPGASLQWIRDNPTSGISETPYGLYPNALPNYSWTAISLQSGDRQLIQGDNGGDAQAASFFIDLTRTNPANSKTIFYIDQRWPRNEPTNTNLPHLADGRLDYRAQWLRTYTGKWDNSYWTRDYFDDYIHEMWNRYPQIKDQIRMVPVGDVLFEINERMRAGQYAQWGYSDIVDVYDHTGHMTNVGQYIIASTYYATMYHDSPVGLGVPTQYGPRTDYPEDQVITPDLAAAIQDAAWDVTSVHPYAAVPEPASIALLVVPGILLLRRRSA